MAKDIKVTSGGQQTLLASRAFIETTADGKLEAPDHIIQTPNSARAIYATYRAQSLKRIALWSALLGQIAGNPPYDPAELEAAGLGHIANFNNMDAKGLSTRSSEAFWNLINQTEFLIDVQLRAVGENAYDWGQIISEHFSDMVRNWGSFRVMTDTLTGQLSDLGLSPCMWTDERSYKWRTIQLDKFMVPDQALSDLDQLTSLFVESTFTVQYLMEVYEKFKDAPKDSIPWNIDELGRFILYRANTAVTNDQQVLDMVQLQSKITNGDYTWTNLYTDQVTLVSMLYKEYNGKVSHYMFDRFYTHTEFPFVAWDQYEDFGEAFQLLTGSPGSFTIHGNKGVGHMIYSGTQATNRLDCAAFDGASWALTPMLSSPATGVHNIEPIRFTPGSPTIIGSAEVQQLGIGENLSEVVQLSQYMLGKMQTNLAAGGEDPGLPDRDSAVTANIPEKGPDYQEFGIPKQVVDHFYGTWDRIIRNMFVKAFHCKDGDPDYDETSEFKKRCIEDGVPEQLFSTAGIKRNKLPSWFKSTNAARVVGNGSYAGILRGLKLFSPLIGGLGPRASSWYKKQIALISFGRSAIPILTAEDQSPDEAAGGASLAATENFMCQTSPFLQPPGSSPVFSKDNEQKAHFVTHTALGDHLIELIQQQQIDVVKADGIFGMLIPHMDEHWADIIKNPFEAEFAAKMEKPWKQLRDYAQLNRKNAARAKQAEIKKQQQDQEATQQVMSDAQRKDFTAQRDAKRSDLVASAKISQQDQERQTRGDIMKQKALDDGEVARLRVEGENQAKQLAAGNNPLTETLGQNRQDLQNINGPRTPAPYDIENPTDGIPDLIS